MTGAVVTALLLTGCQGEDEPEPGGSPTPTSTTTPTTDEPTTEAPTTDEPTESETATGTETSTGGATETETSGEPTGDATETGLPPSSLPPWTSEMSEQAPGQAAEPQEITGVRTGLHEGYDRVVLDLTGDEVALGWFARLVDETFEDGSGRPVEVEGERFLELGVNGIDWTTDRPERYDGGTVQGQGTEVVTEVVFGVLFEGQQQIFVGLTEDTEYRIFPLSDPARIVIDVRHP
ncbi:hypothetical protein GCM10011509_28240 [Ornithinimicrobium pekingense]|uniref:AMIN-like domain-containing protein n=2 Tax=Ornithinimicrobium pekingense TaxID=384677 RepID=A0ABQ2FBG2_9MICO|nr:hypothetical protein GCM10011509_28240 [Ornithinimicrobium pekingense]